MKTKKTGLGRSLLLEPTSNRQHSSPSTPRFPDVQEPELPGVQDSQAPESAQRPEVQRIRRRSTIHLDLDVHEQLDIAARVEKKQRSQIVSDMLRQHLPRYHVEVVEAGDSSPP